jgi:hypothetical protein
VHRGMNIVSSPVTAATIREVMAAALGSPSSAGARRQ